ncbi:hypothetical protein [Asanoa siamensis]|uniref:hypothetical protein n=1 Tax=Asanoa siamensis TaxID=926357 RepID=UPI001EF21C68|nr:hypothetical protein [Asanoa siamensis]
MADLTVDALEQAGGADLPIADENLTWHEMLTRIAAAVGRPRPVRRLPAAAVHAALRTGGALQSLRGKESGANPSHLAPLMLADEFVEPTTGRSVDDAIRATFSR